MFSHAVPLASVTLGALTTSAANETDRVPSPSAMSIPLLQRARVTEKFGPAEVWRPVGLHCDITTATTVTAPVVTLRKNGVTAATGGAATIPISAATTTRLFLPFTDYTFAAADAAGDNWSVLVTTTSTAGVVDLWLVYTTIRVPGITDGVNL